jgi:argininosuccinate synthase
VKRVCLSYSGGLDTSVILHWLIEHYGCEVMAFTADIGQEEELSGLPEKARATGAVDCVVRDLRDEFVRDYVFPAIRGNGCRIIKHNAVPAIVVRIVPIRLVERDEPAPAAGHQAARGRAVRDVPGQPRGGSPSAAAPGARSHRAAQAEPRRQRGRAHA